ncbi:MAG: hypothetical protein ACYDEG_10145 [bacterium]
MTKKEIKSKIASLENKDASSYVLYDDMIDEVTPPFKAWCIKYHPSDVLKKIDPTAYQEGYNQWSAFYISDITDDLNRESS